MSSGSPFPFRRELESLDKFLAGEMGAGWEELEQSFFPAQVPRAFDPGDELKRNLAALYHTPDGRQIIEWLADLTWRAPYPHVGAANEAAALAAAKHEARCAVGEVIMKAIAEGYQSIMNSKESKP